MKGLKNPGPLTSRLQEMTPCSSSFPTRNLLDTRSRTPTLCAPCNPVKQNLYMSKVTVGGDHLDAYQDMRLPAVCVTKTKLHLNSIISDTKHGTRYCTADLNSFFLGSYMIVFQYMQLHCKYVNHAIFVKCNLTKAQFDLRSFCSIEIRKGIMYRLKEVAILAYEQLCDHLAPFGYSPVPSTPGLWHDATRGTTFTLAINGFGIKFFSKSDANHLFITIATKYTMSTNWSRTSYLGFTIHWNYNNGWVDISMPGYVPKAMLTLKHPDPSKPQHAPHCWTVPAYSQKVQFPTLI